MSIWQCDYATQTMLPSELTNQLNPIPTCVGKGKLINQKHKKTMSYEILETVMVR